MFSERHVVQIIDEKMACDTFEGKMATKNSPIRYDSEVKKAFLKAAQGARAAGKSWDEAHAAASQVGYKGSMPGLYQLMLTLNAQRKKKKFSKVVMKRARKVNLNPYLSNDTVNEIQFAIDAEVNRRVKREINRLVRSLKEKLQMAKRIHTNLLT